MNGELPEAPASVTYSITSKGGFNALFTIREMTGLALLEKMAAIEKKLIELEYKPQIKTSSFPKKELELVPGVKCPKCGNPLKVIHAKTGKIYHSCTNSKYNPTTGKYDGCDYFTSPTQKPIPVETYDLPPAPTEPFI